MKIVEKSKHLGIITFKGSTNLRLGLPTEDARSDDPRLVSTCYFADVILVHARRILSFMSSDVVGATAITRSLTKPHKK